MKRLVLGIAWLCMVPVNALAGAWVQEPGTAYVRTSAGWLATRERFDDAGDRAPVDAAGGGVRNTRVRDFSASAYVEVGVARDWNVNGWILWKRLEAEQPAALFTTWGAGDFGLGVKRAITRGPGIVSAVGVHATIPTGYDESEYPALGSGVVDLSFVGEAGKSYGSLWVTSEAGFTVRGGDFSNQVRGAFGGGWSTGRLGLRGEVRGAAALSGSDTAGGGTRFDPTDADPSHLDLAGAVSFRVAQGLALEGDIRGTVVGENTLAGTRVSLSLATAPAWRWR